MGSAFTVGKDGEASVSESKSSSLSRWGLAGTGLLLLEGAGGAGGPRLGSVALFIADEDDDGDVAASVDDRLMVAALMVTRTLKPTESA